MCDFWKNAIVGCIYRHPKSDLARFTAELENILTNLDSCKHDVYILGDMNIDFLKCHTHPETDDYINMIFTHGFLPIITKATRITDHSATLIDHIYTNANLETVTAGIALFDISDHLPIFAYIDKSVRRQTKRVYYRDYSTFDRKLYIKDLNEINWEHISDSCLDLHEKTSKVIEIIQTITDRHAPMKLASRSKRKQLNKPWITAAILKSIKHKQKMYRTHYCCDDNEKKEEYKRYANMLTKLIKYSKKEYYNHQFHMHKDNLKSTWKVIGTLIKRKTKGQTIPNKLVRNNITYSNPKEIAEQFNEYFVNIGPTLASKIETINEDPTRLIQRPSSSFFISPTTPAVVKDLFSTLNANKSSLDIPNKLIKIACEPLSLLFTNIYNESISSGIVPNSFKISRVTPIYKDDSVTEPGNYRPIATLSPFAKILERIIYNQLSVYLDKHNLLYKYQFGFRKGHSTEHAVLELSDKLKHAIDEKLITCGIFLDFSKAFDTVNHDILLQKLSAYGIRGLPYKWFENYLSNRQQFVKIHNESSSLQTMTCGVPQGSTLGPLLFLLYINDLPCCSDKFFFRMFADDSNIFYSGTSPTEIEMTVNNELKNVYRYCQVNKLSINFKKTNYMVIRSPQMTPKINIIGISQVKTQKYLGIYIDEHLNWKTHIDYINNKLARTIAIVSKLRHFVNIHVLKQIYYALFYPYLSYGIVSWGNTYKTSLYKIATKQNKCIKRIFFANDRHNAIPFYKLLEILTLENIFKLKTAVLTHHIYNNTLEIPTIFKGSLTLASHMHNYKTRYATNKNFLKPKARTNYGKFTFKFTASTLWTTIPTEIKSLNSKAFQLQYKKHLLFSQ